VIVSEGDGPVASALLASLLAVVASTAVRQASAAEAAAVPDVTANIQFDIPRQPLTSALVAFGRASGVQVLYDSGIASQQSSMPVSGEMTGGQALRVLLVGSGFVIRYAGPRSVTLVRPSTQNAETSVVRLGTLHVQADAPRIGERPRFAAYAEQVLDDVKKGLQNDAYARRGRYSLKVRLWLTSDGHIERSEILDSSGRPEIDATVLRRLQHIVLSAAPPPDLPQPLMFVFGAQPLS
jgi:TonB family protein